MKTKLILLTAVLPQGIAAFQDDANADYYYGVSNGSMKGFITYHRDSDRWVAMCSNGLTGGNNWDAFSSDTLNKTIRNILSNSQMEVIQFETHKELYTWLAKS